MSVSPPTDLELVRGLHARDRQALVRVYGDYHAAIYNLCARILGDREEAKDVTQDVFLKALASPPPATEDVRLRPWLFRVATNACLNLIRSRRPAGATEPDALAAATDPYEQARSAALIEGALGAMNERYRAALVLKDLHGVGGEELADVLEISRPAADVLVHRARAAFRRAFAGLAGDDAVVPADLAVALPVLAVPAALQAFPLTVGPSGAAPALVPPAGAGTVAASGAGPAVGALGKIGAALSTKAAVTAAGAAVVAGGGVAVMELDGHGTTPAPAGTPAATKLVHDGSPGAHDACGARDFPPHRRSEHHAAGSTHHASHHSEGGAHDSSHHSEGGAHDAGEHAADHAGSGDHSGGDHGASGSHDSGGDHAAAPGGGSTSAPTTTSAGHHDGDETGHGWGDD